MSLKPVVGEISISNTQFKWILDIKEFNPTEKNQRINSSIFFVHNTVPMYLQLSPKGDIKSTDGYISLYLKNDNDYDVTLDFRFSLLNNEDKHVNQFEFKDEKIKSKWGLGKWNFISESFVLNPANKLIKNGKLTFVCTINNYVCEFEKKFQNLKNVTEKLFTNKKHSDITIKCGRNKFFLHKNILATQSSVFASIFETSAKNMVEISDIDPKVLRQFFKYLYTNTVDDFEEETVKDLLIVADRYLVTDLKDKCEEILCDNIKIKNAIEYLKMSEVHNANSLKIDVINFLATNFKEFIDKPEFKSLTEEQLQEIMNRLMYLIKNKK